MTPRTRKHPAAHKRRGPKPGGLSVTEMSALRMAAEMIYVTDVISAISIREVAEMPQFAGVSIRTIEAWAAEDNWASRRRERAAQFRQGLEERLHNQIIQAQSESLKHMEALYSKSLAIVLSGDGPQPKSYEAVGTLTLRLHEHIHKVRCDMLDKIMPPAPPADDDAPEDRGRRQAVPDDVIPDLNIDEARIVAHTVMRLRQQSSAGALPPGSSAPVEEGNQEEER